MYLTQNSAVHKRKGHGVTKSPTYIVNSEGTSTSNTIRSTISYFFIFVVTQLKLMLTRTTLVHSNLLKVLYLYASEFTKVFVAITNMHTPKVPGGDSAYHDTCSVPGDLDSCLSLNEPYSGVSDTDLGNLLHIDAVGCF